MAKREYTVRRDCAHEGCAEFAFYRYATQREMRDSRELNRPWSCVRHHVPDEVLSIDSPRRMGILTATKGKNAPGLYWNGVSGFTHGPGFKAFADDFPEGTRLVITARIELPEPNPPTKRL